MTDPYENDERLRNRITEAVRHLNGFSTGLQSDEDIAAQLDAVTAEPLSEDEVGRIMNTVHHDLGRSSVQEETDMRKRNSETSQAIGRPTKRTTGSSSLVVIIATSACLLAALGVMQVTRKTETEVAVAEPQTVARLDAGSTEVGPKLVAYSRPEAPPAEAIQIGESISTGERERRRVRLPDGSVLFVNEQTSVSIVSNRRLSLTRGDVFVEVIPAELADAGKFVIETPDRAVTALGTKFAVSAADNETNVLVTQGKVRVSGVASVLKAGQEITLNERIQPVTRDGGIVAARRASEALSWTRELMAAAEPVLVPRSEHAGGSIVVVDPNGQEMRLSLRKFHVDVHIQDGFARTTIDQTYFNHTFSRQEGTFHFPLPPDASLSRLAMYVGPKLMEGGMAERQHARNVYEQIRHTRRDPALLEWVDGSTFKMRVFPLEARQEKRLVLSYTQRLPNDYDRTLYRFPAGHSLESVGDWTTEIRVDGGATAETKQQWFSPSHLLKATEDDGDLLLEGELQNAALDKDLVVELKSAGDAKGPSPALRAPSPPGERGRQRDSGRQPSPVRFSSMQHEGMQYLMLRYRPDLTGDLDRPKRNWVFLFESSGDRDPLVARVQVDVIRTLLENAEHDDTFSIVRAATRSESFRNKPVRCSRKNIDRAVAFLDESHLVGALDVGAALQSCDEFCDGAVESWLVHVGSATPAIGERDERNLLKRLPKGAKYVGVGVGKRWAQSFMKSAAGKTGGHFTQINPDEKVAWRAFELLSTLNAPRLLEISAKSERKNARWLSFAETIAHGQEIAAVTRIPMTGKLPQSVTIRGMIDGEEFEQTLDVDGIAENAGYLPRIWARREIDRLVAAGAEKHKDDIIALSKAMYVMSPFTSLLVLEDEAMYEQFAIDRGRKDHWALYPAPPTIDVVYEPGPAGPVTDDPIEVVQESLKRQRALRDVARANFDLSKREGRVDQLERLTAMFEAEEQKVTSLERQLSRLNEVSEDAVSTTFESVIARGKPADGDGLHGTASWYGGTHWGFVPPSLMELPIIDGFNSHQRSVDGWLPRDGSKEVSAALAAFDARFTANFTWGENTRFGRNSRNGLGWMEDVNGNGVLDFDEDMNGDGVLDVDDYGINVWSADSRLLSIQDGRAITNWDVSRRAVQLWDLGTRRRPGVANLNSLRGTVRFGDEMLANRIAEYELAGRMQPEARAMWRSRFAMRDLSNFNFSAPESSRQLLEDESLRRRANGRGFSSYFLNTFGRPTREKFVFTVDDSSSMDGVSPFNLGVGLRAVVVVSDGDLSELELSDPLSLIISQSQSVESKAYGKAYGELSSVPVFTMPLPYRVSGSWGREFGQNRLFASHPQIKKFLSEQKDWQEDVLLSRSYAVDELILGGSVRSLQSTLSLTGATRMALDPVTVPTVRYVQVPGNNGSVPVVVLPPSVLRDPVSYAPGMESSTADLLAVLEAETDQVSVKRGAVDRRAKKLIERSRKRGWETVTIPGRNGVGDVTVLVDGAGRYKFERRLTDGLVEQVVCDGETLWHLYPDLMIGAERSVSRFHRRAVHSLIPWLVAQVDDLAIGANIELVDRHTIRIVSMRDKSEGTDELRLAVDLVFDDESRLTERRVVNLADDKVLQRVSYGADGTITVFAGASDKSRSLKLVRQAADAPNVTPSTDGLVVLPLPYRSAESYAVAVDVNGDGETDYSKLPEADAMKMIATYFATRDAASMWQIIQQRFVAREDSRTGFATLLSSANPQDSTPIHEVASQNQGPVTHGTPGTLGSFLVQWYDWQHDRDLNREFVMPEHSSPFLLKLARAHNVLARWVSGRATQDRSKGQIRTEFRRAIAMIQEIESPAVGWRLLNSVAQRFTTDGVTDAAYLAPLAAEAARFEKYRGLSSQARLARIRWLLAAGHTEKSQELYAEFLDTAASFGLSPMLDADIHTSFEEKFGNNAVWRKLVKKAGAMLATKDRPIELIALAAQCVRNSEQDLGQSLFESAMGNLDLDEHPYVAVAGLSYSRQAEDWATAEKCLQALFQDDRRLRIASLWRQASDIAAQLGDEDESLRRYEQAVELEFADLPDMINLEQLRQEYGPLLARLEEFAQTRVIAEESIPDDLVARVIRLADRWRSIDPDKTAACHAAARILEIVGEPELAWDYWTTPVAASPNDSSAWMALGRSLRDRSRIGDADRAFSEAFACEQTNPDILIERADMLLLDGQRNAAMKLYGQISVGSWQPRFNGTKSRATAVVVRTVTGSDETPAEEDE